METDVDTSLSLNRIRNSERLTDFLCRDSFLHRPHDIDSFVLLIVGVKVFQSFDLGIENF